MSGIISEHRKRLESLGLWPDEKFVPRPTVTAEEIRKAKDRAIAKFWRGGQRTKTEIENAVKERASQVLQQGGVSREIDDDLLDYLLSQIWRPLSKYVDFIWGIMLSLNLLFLNSDLPASPSHLGALTLDVKDETVQALLDINTLGFYTLDSQPGTCSQFHSKDEGIELQREYIDGLYPVEKWRTLYDDLVAKNLNVFVIDGKNRIIASTLSSNNQIIPDVSNVRQDRLPLTVSRLESMPQWEIDSSRQFARSQFREPFDFLDANLFADWLQWLRENTVNIVVISERFCEPGQVAIKLRDALARNV